MSRSFKGENVILFLVLFLSYFLGISDGVSSATIRIVGGEDASPHQFPFVVSLRNKNGKHFCAGTLLNEQWVLTSAHCSRGFELSELPHIQIVAGDLSLLSHDESEQRRLLLRIVGHPDFTLELQPPPNDIALWQTTEDFDFEMKNGSKVDSFIGRVTLDGPDFVKTGSATAIGWGRFYKDGYVPQFLRKVVVPLVTLEGCASFWADFHQLISERMICAGKDGKGTCAGDSGGPLMCSTITGQLVQCGIVSSGYPCARGYPDVYTRVDFFLDFINETISQRSRPKSDPLNSLSSKSHEKSFFKFWFF